MAKGWIRINRKILEHRLWEDKPFAKGQAWIDLLLLAEWCDGRQVFCGKETVTLKRGQLCETLRFLGNRWGWSKDKVSRFFMRLSAQGMVSICKTGSKQVITIENYTKYQIDVREERDKVETKSRQVPREERDKSETPTYLYNKRTNKQLTTMGPFRPPTPEEVRAYADEAGIVIDEDIFCDFYASKGWKVGKESMKDWKAAARGWAKRHQNEKPRRDSWDFMDL